MTHPSELSVAELEALLATKKADLPPTTPESHLDRWQGHYNIRPGLTAGVHTAVAFKHYRSYAALEGFEALHPGEFALTMGRRFKKRKVRIHTPDGKWTTRNVYLMNDDGAKLLRAFEIQYPLTQADTDQFTFAQLNRRGVQHPINPVPPESK